MSDDTPEMVERVARAILQVRNPGIADIPLRLLLRSTDPDETHMAEARAAIAAMREPTVKMVQAAQQEYSLSWSSEPGEGRDWNPADGSIWRAMIDAALDKRP